MNGMGAWTAAVGADLGLDPGALDTEVIRIVLDLTGDVAHGVNRPAAPVTAYLVGVAVGRGLALPDASERVRALAASWGEHRDPALPDSYGPADDRRVKAAIP